MCEKSWPAKKRTMEPSRWTLGNLTKLWEGHEDVNAVQRHDQRQYPNEKSRSEPDSERRPHHRQTAIPSPPIPRQPVPRDRKTGRETSRDRKPGSEEAKQSVLKGVWCCPSADDCQDVDEVGTEPSSDADSDMFGLDWGDDTDATINSVTERNDRTRGGKELLAFVDSSAVDNVLPKMLCTENPLLNTT